MSEMIISAILSLIFGGVMLVLLRYYSARSADAESLAIGRIASFTAGEKCDVAAIGKGIALLPFARCVVFVSDRTTEDAAGMIRIIVKYYHIESYLIERARRSSSNADKAYYLALLARLPLTSNSTADFEDFLTDSFARVRFYALLCIFSSDSNRAVSLLSRIKERLSRRDVAEIMTIIGRGFCPIPYTPLLISGNYNLSLLGITLVRRFGIRECEGELMRFVSYGDCDLREDAIETLVWLGAADSELEVEKSHVV